MIKNFKYYINGTPKNPADPVYALYQPVLDRFLIVVDSYKFAHTLSALLITRYPTYVCCVSDADNYQHNIIDNEVCDSWTFTNYNDIAIEDSLKNTKPIIAKHLVPTINTMSWNMVKEKEWILFCRYCLHQFEIIKEHCFSYYQIDSILSPVLPADNIEYYPYHIEHQVLDRLFFGTDIEKTTEEILNIINSNSVISNLWELIARK